MQGVAAEGNDHLVCVRPVNWIPRRSGPPSICGRTVPPPPSHTVYLTWSAGLGGGDDDDDAGDPSNFDGLALRDNYYFDNTKRVWYRECESSFI